VKIELRGGGGALDCVFCMDALGEEPLRACSACSVRVHAGCAEEMPRCSTLGCAGNWQEPSAEPDTPDTPVGEGFTPSLPTEALRRRRPFGRLATALAVPLLLLGIPWLTTFSKHPGQVAELGGWFSGHGGTLAAVLGTCGVGYQNDFGNASVKSVAFSPDGTRVVSLDRDRELIEWDWARGKILRERTLPFAPVFGWAHQVAYAPDRPKILAAIGTYLHVLDTGTGELDEIRTGGGAGISLNDPDVLDLWAGPEGKVLIVYTSGLPTFTVAAIDPTVNGGEPRAVARGKPEQRYQAAAISPDGSAVAAAHEGRIDLWQLRGGRVTPLPVSPGFVYDLAFSPDSTVLAWQENGAIVLWDLPGGREQARLAVDPDDVGYGLCFSPDGARLANWSGGTRVFDATTGEVLQRHPHHRRLTYQVAWSPDGEHLATGGKDQVVRVWEASR
jgi:hypothetical protein